LTSVCATLPDSEIPPEEDGGQEEEEGEEEMDDGEDMDAEMATDETPTVSQSNLSRFALLVPSLLSLIEPTLLSSHPQGLLPYIRRQHPHWERSTSVLGIPQ
jgi:hypothetical protein